MRACLCVLACFASLAACSTIALNGTSTFALTKSGSSASVSVRVSAQPHLTTGQQFYVTLASNATCTVNVTSNLPFFPRTIVSFPGRRLLANTVKNGLLETPSLPPSTWKFSIALVNGSCACEFAAIELPTQPLVPGYGAQFNEVDPLGGVFFLYTSSEPFDLRNVTISVPGVACTVTAADSFSYACNYESGTTTTSYNVSLAAGDSLVIPSYGAAAPPTVSGFWPANSTVFIFLQVTGPASSACSAFTVSIADMPPLPLSAHAPPLVISSAASNSFFAHFIATSPKVPYQLRANYMSGNCGDAEFQWTGNPLVRPWSGQCNPNYAAFIGNEFFMQNQSHYEQPIAGPAGETWVWALFSYLSSNCSLAVSMQ